MPIIGLGLLIPIALIVLWCLSVIRITHEYEQGVVLRRGRFAGTRSAGLKWLIPFIDRMIIIDMRITAEQVPPQDVITRDNVSVKVNAVIYFRVMQADRAFLQVTDFLFATSQFAQTTLRSVLGQVDMDDLLSQRDKINRQLQEIIDRHTEPWGVKVTAVEVKQVDLPEEMRRAMAKQAEAERERRSKIIAAEGETGLSARTDDDEAAVAAHAAAEERDGLARRVRRGEAAADEVGGVAGEGELHDPLAVAGAGDRGERVVRVGAAAEERRVAHAPRELHRRAARRGRRGEMAAEIARGRADGAGLARGRAPPGGLPARPLPGGHEERVLVDREPRLAREGGGPLPGEEDVRNPVSLARAVMERTDHVLL